MASAADGSRTTPTLHWCPLHYEQSRHSPKPASSRAHRLEHDSSFVRTGLGRQHSIILRSDRTSCRSQTTRHRVHYRRGLRLPSNADNITTDVVYHGLALQGNNDQPLVKVMNTDDCFRHFLPNTTEQTQLTAFVNQTASNVMVPYPVGLSTPAGVIVANLAYGGDPTYAANFSNNAYHGVSSTRTRCEGEDR